jgi:hypothetical protein
MQELPEVVRATVDSIHLELQGTMKKLAAKGKLAATGRRRSSGSGQLMGRNLQRKSAEAWRFSEGKETTDMAWLHGSLKFAAKRLGGVPLSC